MRKIALAADSYDSASSSYKPLEADRQKAFRKYGVLNVGSSRFDTLIIHEIFLRLMGYIALVPSYSML